MPPELLQSTFGIDFTGNSSKVFLKIPLSLDFWALLHTPASTQQFHFFLFFALSPPSFNGVNMFATEKIARKNVSGLKAHNWQVGNEPLTFVPPLIFLTDARRVMFALLSPALIFLTTPLVDSTAEVKASHVTERVSLRVYFPLLASARGYVQTQKSGGI